MDVFLLAVLTTCNALFAMSEMALSTARRARLAALAETGDAGAKSALALMEDPTRFLSTVQIGITSIGMLSGIVGEAAFAGPLARWMEGRGLGSGAARQTKWLRWPASVGLASPKAGGSREISRSQSARQWTCTAWGVASRMKRSDSARIDRLPKLAASWAS